MKQAVADAVDRGRLAVEEEDLYSARRQYSHFAFKSVISEDDPRKGRLESILVQFSRTRPVQERSEVDQSILAARVEDADVEFYRNLLVDVNFLGVETSDGFRYPADEQERRLLIEVAQTAAHRHARDERYQVNAAFYDVLQIR